MTDAKPEQPKGRAFRIIGLLGATAAIAIPIGWDWYSNRVAVEIDVTSEARVLEPDTGINRLQVTYGGAPIHELSRVGLRLTNSGRTPITSEATKTPITIAIDGPAEILDVQLGRLSPPELAILPSLDSTHRVVALQSSLINPGDAVELSLLVNRRRPTITSKARIEGLHAIQFTDSRDRRPSLIELLPWSVWVVGPLSGLLALAVVICLPQMGAESLRKRLFQVGLLQLPPHTASVGELRAKLRGAYRFGHEAELKLLEGHFIDLPDASPMPLERYERLAAHFAQLCQATRPLRLGLGALAFLAFVGLGYSVFQTSLVLVR